MRKVFVGLVLLFVITGCSGYISDADAEDSLAEELAGMSDEELITVAEETEGGQAIAGMAIQGRWSRVSTGTRSKMMARELGKRLSRYAISDEPAFQPKPGEVGGKYSISDEPAFQPKPGEVGGKYSISDDPVLQPKEGMPEGLLGEDG